MNVPKLNLDKEFVMSQIKDVKFFYDDMLTICVLTTLSDFKIVAYSACHDPLKYSAIIGREAAHAKAVDNLFEHCAFYLKTISHN